LATAKNDLEIEKSHRQELETRRKALKWKWKRSEKKRKL
jgi:hypothetical protein